MHPIVYKALQDANFEVDVDADDIDLDDDAMDKTSKAKHRSNEIKRAIIKFFVKDRLPLAKMESVHFNHLINGLYLF